MYIFGLLSLLAIAAAFRHGLRAIRLENYFVSGSTPAANYLNDWIEREISRSIRRERLAIAAALIFWAAAIIASL